MFSLMFSCFGWLIIVGGKGKRLTLSLECDDQLFEYGPDHWGRVPVDGPPEDTGRGLVGIDYDRPKARIEQAF